MPSPQGVATELVSTFTWGPLRGNENLMLEIGHIVVTARSSAIEVLAMFIVCVVESLISRYPLMDGLCGEMNYLNNLNSPMAEPGKPGAWNQVAVDAVLGKVA